MKTFKIIDLSIQIIIVITAVVTACSDPISAILIFFLGLLAWNIISLIINLFLPIAKSFSLERIGLYVHTAVIIAIPFMEIEVGPKWHNMSFWAYIAYAVGLVIYYMILCYRELRYLNNLRDQIRLIDVQHH